MLPMQLMDCPSLAVPPDVMHHVVDVESSFNPYAIGVVGGRLVRQPKNLPEALATARMLASRGFNFSLGLAQVNRYNLGKYGLDSYEKAFQACPNLQAGSRILAECYNRSGNDWGRSFSCYYSGNFVTGYRDGYVQKIFASMHKFDGAGETVASHAIDVIARPDRRTADVSRHPMSDSAREPQRVTAANVAASRAESPAAAMPENLSGAGNGPVSIAMLAPSGQPPKILEATVASAAKADGADNARDAAFVF